MTMTFGQDSSAMVGGRIEEAFLWHAAVCVSKMTTRKDLGNNADSKHGCQSNAAGFCSTEWCCHEPPQRDLLIPSWPGECTMLLAYAAACAGRAADVPQSQACLL